jgi:hypothetical protein
VFGSNPVLSFALVNATDAHGTVTVPSTLLSSNAPPVFAYYISPINVASYYGLNQYGPLFDRPVGSLQLSYAPASHYAVRVVFTLTVVQTCQTFLVDVDSDCKIQQLCNQNPIAIAIDNGALNRCAINNFVDLDYDAAYVTNI